MTVEWLRRCIGADRNHRRRRIPWATPFFFFCKIRPSSYGALFFIFLLFSSTCDKRHETGTGILTLRSVIGMYSGARARTCLLNYMANSFFPCTMATHIICRLESNSYICKRRRYWIIHKMMSKSSAHEWKIRIWIKWLCDIAVVVVVDIVANTKDESYTYSFGLFVLAIRACKHIHILLLDSFPDNSVVSL